MLIRWQDSRLYIVSAIARRCVRGILLTVPPISGRIETTRLQFVNKFNSNVIDCCGWSENEKERLQNTDMNEMTKRIKTRNAKKVPIKDLVSQIDVTLTIFVGWNFDITKLCTYAKKHGICYMVMMPERDKRTSTKSSCMTDSRSRTITTKSADACLPERNWL